MPKSASTGQHNALHLCCALSPHSALPLPTHSAYSPDCYSVRLHSPSKCKGCHLSALWQLLGACHCCGPDHCSVGLRCCCSLPDCKAGLCACERCTGRRTGLSRGQRQSGSGMASNGVAPGPSPPVPMYTQAAQGLCQLQDTLLQPAVGHWRAKRPSTGKMRATPYLSAAWSPRACLNVVQTLALMLALLGRLKHAAGVAAALVTHRPAMSQERQSTN